MRVDLPDQVATSQVQCRCWKQSLLKSLGLFSGTLLVWHTHARTSRVCHTTTHPPGQWYSCTPVCVPPHGGGVGQSLSDTHHTVEGAGRGTRPSLTALLRAASAAIWASYASRKADMSNTVLVFSMPLYSHAGPPEVKGLSHFFTEPWALVQVYHPPSAGYTQATRLATEGYTVRVNSRTSLRAISRNASSSIPLRAAVPFSYSSVFLPPKAAATAS